MSSPDPPDDREKRGVRQTMRSNIQRAKDLFKRPSTPIPPAATSEHLAPSSLRYRLPSFLGRSNPALIAGAPSESEGSADTPGPSTDTSVPKYQVDPASGRKKRGDITKNRLASSLYALESSVGLFPPLKSAVGAFIECLDTVLIAESNRADYEELANDFESMADVLKQYSGELKSESNSGSTAYIAQSIQHQVADIKKQNERGTIGRLLDAVQDQEEMIRRHRQVDRLFRQLQCDLTMRTKESGKKQLETTLLRGMLPVDDARYNSSYSTTVRRRGCTAKTREAVHQALQDWTTNPGSEKIYWMNGMAGTGKTTIAYSYCEWLKSTNRLGASFFCSRISSTCRSLSQIVPTIAYQLAHFSPAFRSTLCAALNDDPETGKLNVRQQFEGLINLPMVDAKSAMPDNVVVVIDALDECDDAYSVRLLLDVLLQFAAHLPLKFFVASRPEHAIRDRMVSKEGAPRAIVHLHDIEKSIVEEDIKKYLTEALSSMSAPPSVQQIAALAKRSRNLFIYAATVVRYIYPEDIHVDSNARLKSILATITDPSAMTGNKYEDLDRLYTTVLRAVFDKRLDIDEKARMRRVLWTIVCAQEPMTVATIASLASLEEDQVWAALQSLQSVVHVPESNDLISALHASFPEYMLEEQRSGEFYCNKAQSNETLVHRLFDVMKMELRFNICNLQSSYLADDQVEGLEARVNQSISPPLSYACRYWSSHLQLAPASSITCEKVISFVSNWLLFWMEVLSLNRCIGIGASMMQETQYWLRGIVDTTDEIQKWVSDARNFVTWFAANPCSQSTPHIYISALATCAKSNWVYQHYSKHTEGLADITMSQQDDAALAIWTAESIVYSVSLSPDGGHVAAGLGNGDIHIYDIHTGAIVVGPLKGHTDDVNSVVLSLDGSMIASGSDDMTVIVWDAQTGRMVTGPLHGHTSFVLSVALSPDGSRIVSGSLDKTVIVWDRHSGSILLGPLKGHSMDINSVAFSPDGRLVASGSHDCTVRVWDTSTGTVVNKPLEGHKDSVLTVAFSPTGNQIVSGSSDKTIRVWDIQTGSVVQVLQGHPSGVTTLAYSLDRTRIVSGGDGTGPMIMIWDVDTGLVIVGPLRGHTSSVRGVAFSHDGTRIVSCSHDKTIRTWDVQTRTTDPGHGIPKVHKASSGSVTFSPDRTQFISSSLDGQLRAWDMHTGAAISRTFEHQSERSPMHAIVFDHQASRVATSSDDFSIQLWDVPTGVALTQPLTGHSSPVRCLAFSPDGASISSGSDDGTIIAWDTETGTMIGRPYEAHTGSVRSVAYSPDGTRIASGAADHTVRVWDPATGTLVHTLSGHKDSVNSVGYSPDGRYIVSGGDDEYVRRWGVNAPSDSARYRCWVAIDCVAVSPDGTRVVAGCGDSIRVLDAQLTEVLSRLSLPSNEWVHWVGFSPDHTIITVSASKKDDARQLTEGTDQEPLQQPNIIRIWQVDTHLDQSDSSSTSGTWSYKDDGRIYSPDGFLLWVSPDVLRYIGRSNKHYRSSYVISSDGIIDLRSKDLDLCIGERWTECYTHKG